MTPSAFTYARAATVEEALALLAEHDNARLIAGGHSLIPAMKLRLDDPALLVDVSRISTLSQITLHDNRLCIGALVTHRAVEASTLVQAQCGALAEAAGGIGDPQVRNRGTLGGSLAHADPAADYPALVLALDADIIVSGATGKRTVGADDFFCGLFETALQDGEMITEAHFPCLGAQEGASYAKHASPASKYAVVGVAAFVAVDATGQCTGARIGITGAATHAFRAEEAEMRLVGKQLNASVVDDAVAGIADPRDMLSDIGASSEYRAHLCSVMAKRAVSAACAEAMG